MPTPRPGDVVMIIILAALYVAAGRIGLQLDAVSGFATLVWAPSGIALAVLLWRGMQLWPGVALGALAVNLWAGAPLLAALAIAAGNTLEPVVAVLLLRRFGFGAFLRVRDTLALFIAGAFLSTMISATIGTISLSVAGVVASGRFGITWISWWLGDAIADLIVAPLLITWLMPKDERLARRRLPEAMALFFVLVAMSLLVFGRRAPAEAVVFLQPYLLTPALIWAAVRFHQRGAATAVFIASVIAVWGTANGTGPFVGAVLFERLGALQALMAMMAVTFLVLGALAAERAHVEKALMEARDAAEAASSAKSRFLAVVSHELRTPLSGITGYAAILLDGLGGKLTEQQTNYIQRMRTAAWHLTSVIDGILTFSRAEAGREEVRLEDADAVNLVRETAALLAPQADTKSLQLRVNAPGEAVRVRTDVGKLRQIVLNLIGNAVKFSDSGAVVVTVQRAGSRFQVVVSDEGPGIPQDRLPEIFEPFTQLLNSNGRGGTGLGLSASRMLAQLLGGSVTVSSEVGQGSTFTVDLPIDPSDQDVAGPGRSGRPAA
jgi:two-component system, NarL family, sensor histidine kinase FusK